MITKKIRKQRLLVIAHSYANFIKDQVECMAPYFDQIDVLVRYSPLAEISNILPINRLKPFRKTTKIDLTDLLANIRVIPLSMFYLPTDAGYKTLGKKHYRAAEYAIRKYDIRFDLIHAHFAWSAGYVGSKLKENYKVPFVVTAHGYDVDKLPFKNAVWKRKIEYVLNTADRIISVSNINIEYLNQLEISTSIAMIPNGFSSKLFWPKDTRLCREQLSLPLDKKIILTVGSLTPLKGHNYLIEAMGQVTKQRQDVLCIIIGEGRLKQTLKKQIRGLQLQDYVWLAGSKPHYELVNWMNTCDTFALPSLKESFGVVQVEALACGKPVVATCNGGSEEIITREDIGYLVAAGNATLLAETILIALGRQWSAEDIGNYARNFRWDDIVKLIMSIYEEVMSTAEDK